MDSCTTGLHRSPSEAYISSSGAHRPMGRWWPVSAFTTCSVRFRHHLNKDDTTLWSVRAGISFCFPWPLTSCIHSGSHDWNMSATTHTHIPMHRFPFTSRRWAGRQPAADQQTSYGMFHNLWANTGRDPV